VAPAGAEISATGLITWTPGAEGVEPITVRVDDGIQWAELSWNITVSAAGTALEADILIDPEVVDAGELITVQVVPSGTAGAATASITVDGNNVPLNAALTASFTESAIGAHEIVARVEDDYDTVTVRKTFYVRDPDDSTIPVATLHNIDVGQEITAPVDVLASIDDENLSSWTLYLISPADPANPQVLAEGSAAVDNAVIGQVDPTLLINGQYILQLEALDASRNTGIDARKLRVTGDFKVGNFSFTITDLEIPVSGIPIRVNRTYDSRQRHQALDFGYGWSLDYQNVKLEESRLISSGWTINEYNYGKFGAFTNYCVEALGSPIVTVTLPNGRVQTFEVHADPECELFQVPINTQYEFVPVDGTTSTLTQTDYGLLRYNNGNILELGSLDAPDPRNYVLTTKEGYVYVIDQEVGLKTVTDPNGNTLTYTDNGIFHSDGKSVLFERDGNGQVTALIDPNNERIEYTRDGNGDLVVAPA